MKVSGNILMLDNELGDQVQYAFPIGNERVDLNQYIGKEIQIKFDGQINCISTGKKIKKTYGEGYSYDAFIKLAACDMCIMKPELCHYAKGTCREPEWGLKHCFQPHYVYLSKTSDVKVGITREVNMPYRWIDQGAHEAIAFMKVKDRFTAGKWEVHIGQIMGDKTDWRKMLKNETSETNLETQVNKVLEWLKENPLDEEKEILPVKLVKITYPVHEYPKEINSLSLDKNPIIKGKLLGIKGQYLLLDCGVLNIRKHQGYFIEFEA